MVKLISFALALGLVLYIFFYLPKQIRGGPGARVRYFICSVLAFLGAVMLLKMFR